MKTPLLARFRFSLVLFAAFPIALAAAPDDASLAVLRSKAESGNAIAQYNLGLAYAQGRQVAADPVEAYVWLSLASENGATGRALPALVEKMSPDAIALAKSRLQERRVAVPGVIAVRKLPESPAAPAPAAPAAEEPAPAAAQAQEASVVSKDQVIADLRADKTRLGEELATAWKETGALRTASAAAEQRARQAETALSQRAKDIIVLQTERSKLAAQLAEAKTASDARAAETETARTQKDAKELADLRADKTRLSEELATAWKETETLRAAGTVSEQRVRQAEAALSQRAGEIETLRTEQARLAAKLTESTAAAKAVPTDEISRLKAQLDENRKKIELLTRDFTAAQHESVRLKDELELARKTAQEDGQMQRDRLLAVSTQLEEAYKQVAAQKAGTSELGETVSRLTRERDDALKEAIGMKEATARQADKAASDLAAANARAQQSAKEFADLRAQNESLSAKLASSAAMAPRAGASDELAGLRAQLAEARQSLASVQQDNQILKTRLTQAEGAAARLAEADAALSKAKSDSEELRQGAAQAAGLKLQITALTQERDVSRRETASLKETVAKQADKTAAELAGANARAQHAEKDAADLRAQADSLTAKLAENAAAAAKATPPEEVARIRNELAEITREAHDIGRQLAFSQKDNQKLKERLAQANAAAARIPEFEISLNRAKAESDSLRQAATQATGDTARLQSQLADLRVQNQSLSAKLAEIPAPAAKPAEDTAKLKSEIEELRDKIDLTVRSFTLAQQENEKLKARLAEAAGGAARAAAAESALTASKLEADALREGAEQASGEITRLRSQITGLAQERDDARRETAALKETAGGKTAKVTADLAEANARAQQASKEATDLRVQNESLSTKLAEAAAAAGKSVPAADAAKLKSDLDEARFKVDVTLRSFTLAQQENEKLKAQLAEAQSAAARVPEAESALARAKQESDALRRGAAQASGDVSRLQSQVAALVQERDAARQEATQARLAAGRADKAAADLAHASARAEQATREAADLRAQNETLTAKLAAAPATPAPTEPPAAGPSAEEFARLKQQLAETQAKVDMTVRSFTLAQQENEKLKTQIDQSGASADRLSQSEAALAKERQETAALRETAGEAVQLRLSVRQLQAANAALTSENTRLQTSVVLASTPAPSGSGMRPTRPSAAPALAAAAAQTAPPPPPPVRTHRITYGDTLTKISAQYYGTARRWQEIFNANRDKIQNPDFLPAGEEIKIP